MIAFLFTALLGCSSSGDVDFRKGLKALRDGDAGAALVSLSDSLEQGGKDPAVYHAMGNSLYRLDRKGEAAAAWRRGLLLSPRDGDIAANLDHVRGEFRDRIDPPTRHRGVFFWQSQMAPIESATLSSIALAVAFGMGLFGRLRRLRHRGSLPSAAKWSAGIAAVVGVLLIVSTADAFYGRQGAVITAEKVDVRSALGPAGVSLFVLHVGAEVLVEERTDTHHLVALSDGRKGWVSASALLSTNPAEPFPIHQHP